MSETWHEAVESMMQHGDAPPRRRAGHRRAREMLWFASRQRDNERGWWAL